MHFNVLGPLEVILESAEVPLRGIRQRACLGFLLLHANEVVAMSHLINALWREGAPPTARKVMQNAIAGVRRVLSFDGADDPATLLTCPPGYLLKVPYGRVDLDRFQTLAESGHRHFATAEHESARRTLREALSLWRGPALADLAEAGVTWPRLAAVQNARLAALEDYAEAALALNSPQEVIARLEPVLADTRQPPRERLSSQLMIALYRAGRQVDALGVYRRARAALVDQLGLDPSRELQDLERAILTHDPGLGLHGPVPVEPLRRPPPPPITVASAERLQSARTTVASQPTDELKLTTVILFRAGLDHPGGHDAEDLCVAWKSLDARVERIARRYGGSVRREAVGSLWTIQFGVPHARPDDVERAICAASELLSHDPPSDRDDRTGIQLVPRVAIATGEALVVSRMHGDDQRVEVTGGVFDASLRLLTTVPPGHLRLCATTSAIISGSASYGMVDRTRVHQLAPTGFPATPPVLAPFLERSQELWLLHRLVRNVQQRRQAHLATVLGELGVGKSRLVAELCRSVASFSAPIEQPEAIRCVVVQTPSLGHDIARSVLNELVRRLQVESGTHSGSEASAAGSGTDDVWERCRLLVEELSVRRQLVVVFEDVHRAGDKLLEFLDDLIRRAYSLRLLVIATACPEQLGRMPSDSDRSTTIMLPPLSDDAVRTLLDSALDPHTTGPVHNGSADDLLVDRTQDKLREHAVARIGGNPLFALEFIRHLRACSRTPSEQADGCLSLPTDAGLALDTSLPLVIRQVVAARLDALPPGDKAVLQDAAVFGDELCPVAVAAVSDRDPGYVAEQLATLEGRGLLRREPNGGAARSAEPVYVFRQLVVREVAYAQTPRAIRADKHSRIAKWLEDRISEPSELLDYHRGLAGTLWR